MKKATEYANELITSIEKSIAFKDPAFATAKFTDILLALCRVEIVEIRDVRNVKTDVGILPIFKEQRIKFSAICRIVDKYFPNFTRVTDFDDTIKIIWGQKVYDLYKENVLTNKN